MTALPVVPSVRAVRDVVRRLAAIVPGSHRVVSCYLKLEPRDRTRGKYLIKLKNRIREVSEALPAEGLTRAELEQVNGDLGRLQAMLQRPDALPKAQGLAVFVSKPLGLFETIPLPR